MSDDDRHTREFTRIEAEFTVRYGTLDQLVVAYTKNFSKGGLFLCTDQVLPINAVVRVDVELPSGGATVAVVCRVAYVRGAAEATTAKPAGMGLQFLDAEGERLAEIERFITSECDAGPESGARAAPRGALDIIVVDDEPLSLDRIARALRAEGHRVHMASDGLEALSACLKKPPNVVVSDVQMPRMDGWQLLRMVRARPTLANVLFLFLTTLDREAERLRGYRLGVDDYIPKESSIVEIVARVDRAVFRAQSGRRQPSERRTLRGDLEQVGVASVLSFLEMERRTGCSS